MLGYTFRFIWKKESRVVIYVLHKKRAPLPYPVFGSCSFFSPLDLEWVYSYLYLIEGVSFLLAVRPFFLKGVFISIFLVEGVFCWLCSFCFERSFISIFFGRRGYQLFMLLIFVLK